MEVRIEGEEEDGNDDLVQLSWVASNNPEISAWEQASISRSYR